MIAAIDGELSIIEPGRLIAPSGRGAEAGYDAADALADWPDTVALRTAAAGLAAPFDPGPAYLSFRPYTMDAGGLAIEKETGKREGKTIVSVRIAASFEVLGACRDSHGAGWGKMLRWRDDDQRQHVRQVTDAELHGEPGALCARLSACGSTANTNAPSQAIFRASARRNASLLFREPAGMRSAGGPFSSFPPRRSGRAPASA
jgi:hypothetical protein